MRAIANAITLLRQDVVRIKGIIAALESLNTATDDKPAVAVSAGVKRTVSPAARRKMAAAQKRRWQRYHASKKAGKRAS